MWSSSSRNNFHTRTFLKLSHFLIFTDLQEEIKKIRFFWEKKRTFFSIGEDILSMKIWITNFEKSTNLRSFAEKNLRKKHSLVFFFGIHRQANKKKFLFRSTKSVRFFYQN